MSFNLKKTPTQNHQETAQSLLDHSPTLKQLFQDQWFYLWAITPQNLMVIDETHQKLSIADGLLEITFLEPADGTDPDALLVQCLAPHKVNNVQSIADFIFNEITFLIRDLKSQHSLFLQTKVQLLRQLLVEQVFHWVDGENRIEHYLYNIAVEEAERLDQVMISAGYYEHQHLTEFAQSGKEIPLNVELNFKHLSLVNSVLGDKFLPVQQLMPIYDQFCFSAQRFIPQPLYRIIESAFDEQFSLAQVIQHQNDFKLLMDHAKEQPHVLGFSQWIKRGYWQYKDIFSKKNFTQPDSVYWDERISNQFPLFYYKRTVNWLFKQDTSVIDWVARHLENLNVRIAVTALSFIDSSQIHPQVILQSLKYFESTTVHFFISDIKHFAEQHQWFDAQALADQHLSSIHHPYVLRNDFRQNPHPQNHYKQDQTRQKGKIEISHSILYIEEWLHLLFLISKDDQRIAKHAYSRLSRVLQAYMWFMQRTIQGIPDALIQFMHPDMQQDPRFLQLLKQHKIDVDDYRNRFKHPVSGTNRAVSVFDSYVADYLNDVFYDQMPLAKNMTWSGLYQQALRWHQQAHFEDTLLKLRKRIHVDSWRRVSPQKIMFGEHWRFEELNSLEKIIHESVIFKHCLALSYTERIAAGEYVAFHMRHLTDENIHLTLGCFFKFEQLHFDQLRLPNNEIAAKDIEQEAKAFIQTVNQHLIWDFKEPKVQ